MEEWGRKGWGRFPGAQPDIGLEPWLLRLDLGCCIPSFWIESFWDGCRGCGSRPSPPGKAVRKGTAFVLRSNSMMSFSPSGKSVLDRACYTLVKRVKHEASLIDQPRPSHVHPTLQLVPTLTGLIPSLCGWTALKRHPGVAGCCKVSPRPSWIGTWAASWSLVP